MLSAEKFIAILVQKDLLPEDVLEGLREQVRQAKKPLIASVLAQRLIEQKLLTPVVVERLLAAARDMSEPAPTLPASEQREEEELGLAPLDDETAPGKPKRFRPATPKNVGSAPTGNAPSGKGQRPGPSPPDKTAESPKAAPAKPTAKKPSPSLLDEELSPLAAPGKAPLDALMAGAGSDAEAGDLLGPASPRRRGLKRFFRDLFRRMRGSNQDVVRVQPTDPRKVALLLGTWGGAVLLLIVAIGVFWYLAGPTSTKLLDSADKAYRAGQYAQAVEQYQAFLEQYPSVEQSSQARVSLGLAKLRLAIQEAQASGDWSPALDTVKAVLPKARAETAFNENGNAAELGVVVAVIADGLAREAKERLEEDKSVPRPATEDKQACEPAELVERAGLAVRMIEVDIPERFRPVDKLAEVRLLLATSEKLVARDREVDRVREAIQEATDKGAPLEAFAARNALVKQYPELAEDGRLEPAVCGAAKLLLSAVKTVPERRNAETAERPSDVQSTVVLVHRSVKSEVRARGVVLAKAGGAVYGLEAATGKPLWRRFVFADDNGQGPVLSPIPLSNDPTADVVLLDRRHKEVVKVEGPTGAFLWRHALTKDFAAQPVQAGNRLFVPTEDRRLTVLDLLTGAATGHVSLPQSCHVPAAVDAERSLLYQVADQSTLYVFSSTDGECRQVFHLGHEPGAVAAPPVVTDHFLLVAVNEGPQHWTLRLLALAPPGQAKDGAVVTPVQRLLLTGQVKVSPVVAGNRVLVVTTLGAVHVFQLASQPGQPLTPVAKGEPSVEDLPVRFPLMLRNRIWVADNKLTQYEVRGRVVPKLTTDKGRRFLQPLVAVGQGQTMFHVWTKPGVPGVTVSAVSMEKQEAHWQTVLAQPLAGEPVVDASASKLTAVTSAGDMFPLESSKVVKGPNLAEAPVLEVAADKLLQPIREVVPMAGGMMALTARDGSQDIFLYDPAMPERFRYLLVPKPLACAPVAAAGGLLAPCKDGSVHLLDLKGSGKLAEPFLREGAEGTEWSWHAAALGEKEAVLSDGQKRLYRMTVQGSPPKLAAAREEMAGAGEATARNRTLVSPVAVVGNVAYVVDSDGAAAAFSLPDLKPGKRQPLEGRCVWGPKCVGKLVLLATDKDRLYSLDDQQNVAWRTPLRHGPLAGSPWLAADSYYLAASGGTVWRIAAAGGEEQGKAEAGVPLGTGPVLLGERLFVSGQDGTVYEVKRP
jgi:outer membrane protein assembly factor BamB/TolA-binding protein